MTEKMLEMMPEKKKHKNRMSKNLRDRLKRKGPKVTDAARTETVRPAAFGPNDADAISSAENKPGQELAPRESAPHAEIAEAELMLGEVLGSGSFASVLAASWQGRHVAVKKFYPNALGSDGDARLAFEAELHILGRLAHPNICPLLGVCRRQLALVLEFAELGCLWTVLRTASLTAECRIRMAKQMADAMAYLHAFSPPILHRDLKSLNILVTSSMTVKIADFGISRVMPQLPPTHSAVPMTGCIGTFQWMAPEVIAKRPYNEKADVFSYGIVLWELFTGKLPYEHLDARLAAEAVVGGLRPPLEKEIPLPFQSLMVDCWAHNPRDRPSFHTVVQRLSRAYPNTTD